MKPYCLVSTLLPCPKPPSSIKKVKTSQRQAKYPTLFLLMVNVVLPGHKSVSWMALANSFSQPNMLESPPLQKDETQTLPSGKAQDGSEPIKKGFPRGPIVLDENGKPWVVRDKIATRWMPTNIWESDAVHVPAFEIGSNKAHIQLRRPTNLGLHHRRSPQHQHNVRHGHYGMLFRMKIF